MASFTPGITFRDDGTKYSPTDFNNLVDQASLTGLSATNFAGGTAGLIFYGNTAPPLQRGAFWYDTSVGSEGLKVAFISASNASISKWLYLTPRRECIVWTETRVSLGYPLFYNRAGFAIGGHQWVTYDGMRFDRVFYYDAASGPHPLMVIPTESVAGSGPVTCMWAGIVPTAVFGNSPLAAGSFVFTNYATPGTFQDSNQGIPARYHVHGVNTRAGTTPGMILWGGGSAIEDLTP